MHVAIVEGTPETIVGDFDVNRYLDVDSYDSSQVAIVDLVVYKGLAIADEVGIVVEKPPVNNASMQTIEEELA